MKITKSVPILFKVVLSSGGLMWIRACTFKTFVNHGISVRCEFRVDDHIVCEFPQYLVDEIYACTLFHPDHLVFSKS